MKKLFFLLLSTALPLAALEVIIDHDSPEAVRDFQYHMRRMTGKDAPLTIFQHPYGVRKKTLTREAFRIKAEKKRVYISGESAKAVSHGLYELLNRLGCDWVMPVGSEKLFRSTPPRKSRTATSSRLRRLTSAPPGTRAVVPPIPRRNAPTTTFGNAVINCNWSAMPIH